MRPLGTVLLLPVDGKRFARHFEAIDVLRQRPVDLLTVPLGRRRNHGVRSRG
jgi:hypothetical protein